jgi:hypothetical protein
MSQARKFGELRDRDTGEVLMEFIGPGADQEPLSVCLRILTHQLQLRTPDISHSHGFFGGAFGYGVEFDNDTFSMCPDYQGCTCIAENPPKHTGSCKERIAQWNDDRRASMVVPKSAEELARQSEIRARVERGDAASIELLATYADEIDFAQSFAWEDSHPFPVCTCGATDGWVESENHEPSCSFERPRFLYKPSGLQVAWYKYIGRDMDIVAEGTPVSLMEIFESCLASIGGPSLREAAASYSKAEDEHSERFRKETAFWMGKEL